MVYNLQSKNIFHSFTDGPKLYRPLPIDMFGVLQI